MKQSRIIFIHFFQKRQISFYIGAAAKSIFGQKDGELRLCTDGGTQRLGIKQKSLTGELILEIELQDVIGQPVFSGKCLTGETAKGLLVIFQSQGGGFQDFRFCTSKCDWNVRKTVIFRMFQGIVKI